MHLSPCLSYTHKMFLSRNSDYTQRMVILDAFIQSYTITTSSEAGKKKQNLEIDSVINNFSRMCVRWSFQPEQTHPVCIRHSVLDEHTCLWGKICIFYSWQLWHWKLITAYNDLHKELTSTPTSYMLEDVGNHFYSLAQKGLISVMCNI